MNEVIAERREHSEAYNRGLFQILQNLHIYIYNIHIYIYYIYICLSARTLHKTVHTLHKSYQVGPLCIVLRNTGCCSKHHLKESTTLRSHPFDRYGRRRQFSWRQHGWRQWLKPYAYSYRTQEAPGWWQRPGPYAYSYRTQEAQR